MPEDLAGERFDRAVARLTPGLSRTRARKVIAMGGAWLGRQRCRVSSRPVQPGDLVTVTWHPAVKAPRRFRLRVLHEDARLVAVSKPSGQHVQGTELGDEGSLIRSLERRYGPDVRLVHRIDAGASGVLVAGRDGEAVKRLSEQFRAHDLERRYLAVTAGVPEEGPCELPLVREGRRVRPAGEGDDGMPARTDVTVLERRGRRSLVEASLHTGRTHQVRVHLATLGAPIVGDRRYGGPRADRLCLHARLLCIRHPDDGRALRFEDEPGDDFWRAADWR
ncbi:MAG: RluA family pseudouridine synthase [Myxococcota bacterium]